MYKLSKDGVINQEINSAIPADPRNTDYQRYLAWLVAGNTPEPADEPSLVQIKAEATARVIAHVDKQIAASGYIPQSQFAGEMVSDIAFMIGEWNSAGRPETMPAAIAVRVELEAAIYGITPLQMIQVWEQKWLAMRNGLAPILAQRRVWLLAIEAAVDAAGVETVLATLSVD